MTKIDRSTLIAIITDAGPSGITKEQMARQTGADAAELRSLLTGIRCDPDSGVEIQGTKRGARYVISGTGSNSDNFQGIQRRDSRPIPGINVRFKMLEALLKSTMSGDNNSMLISGQSGTGKTSLVLRTLQEDLKMSACHPGVKGFDAKKQFMHVKGATCATDLYRYLCENPDGCFVFDDCDSVMADGNGLNILKAVLDTYESRMVSWISPYVQGKLGLPESFQFKGKVIFVTNKTVVPEALTTRTLSVDLTMTKSELCDRMDEIGMSMNPEVTEDEHKEIIEFIREHQDEFLTLSLRTYIKISNLVTSGLENWQAVSVFAN